MQMVQFPKLSLVTGVRTGEGRGRQEAVGRGARGGEGGGACVHGHCDGGAAGAGGQEEEEVEGATAGRGHESALRTGSVFVVSESIPWGRDLVLCESGGLLAQAVGRPVFVSEISHPSRDVTLRCQYSAWK